MNTYSITNGYEINKDTMIKTGYTNGKDADHKIELCIGNDADDNNLWYVFAGTTADPVLLCEGEAEEFIEMFGWDKDTAIGVLQSLKSEHPQVGPEDIDWYINEVKSIK